jgi:CRP-like cAMP-binding protein
MLSTSSAGDARLSGRVSATALRFDDTAVRNQLLAALGPGDLAEIKPYFETVNLEPMALVEADEPIDHVYFPENAVVSLVNTLPDGRTVEVGAVGHEGMVGLPVFLNGGVAFLKAFVHVPGIARRMDARVFRRLSAAPGALHQVMLAYTLLFLTQLAQTATCIGTHQLHQRCACWLLKTRDRVDASEFPLTHEFLSFMLGVRRSGVTLAMRSLRDRHLIRYTRGRVEVVDAGGLEHESCACYHVAKSEYARLLTPAA